MIPHITDDLINDMIQSYNMTQNGRSYWRQGRVSKLRIDAEQEQISAQVQGTERALYRVVISFAQDDFEVGFIAECSCPVGMDCKHCAAVLFAAQGQQMSEAQAIDCAHRIGQTKPAFVHRLIARGTIEEKILSLQDQKRALAATLWGEETDGAGSAKLTEEDVRFLLE